MAEKKPKKKRELDYDCLSHIFSIDKVVWTQVNDDEEELVEDE